MATAALGRFGGSRRAEMLIAAAVLVAGLAVALWSPQVRTVDPDTPSYVDFADWRTAGYPALLDLVEWATGTAQAVIPLQIVVYFGCAMFTILVLWRATGSWLCVGAAFLGVVGNPFVHYFHFKIMTDSLFVAGLVLMLGLAVLAFERRRPATVALLAVVIGILIAIRPSALAFAPMLVVLVLALRPRAGERLRFWLAAAAPLVLLIGAEYAYYASAHGAARRSVAARHIFAKAMMLPQPPPVASEHAALARDAHAAFAPVRAQLRALDAPFAAKHFLATRMEIHGQWGFFDRVSPGAAQAAAMGRIGLAGIAANPLDYLGLALRHYWALWWPPENPSPREAAIVAAHVEALQATPAGPGDLAYNRPPLRAWLAGRLAMVAAFAATWAAILAAAVALIRPRLVAPSPPLLAAGAIALGIHGHQLLVALTAVAIARYANAMLPVGIMIGGILAWELARRFRPAPAS